MRRKSLSPDKIQPSVEMQSRPLNPIRSNAGIVALNELLFNEYIDHIFSKHAPFSHEVLLGDGGSLIFQQRSRVGRRGKNRDGCQSRESAVKRL